MSCHYLYYICFYSYMEIKSEQEKWFIKVPWPPPSYGMNILSPSTAGAAWAPCRTAGSGPSNVLGTRHQSLDAPFPLCFQCSEKTVPAQCTEVQLTEITGKGASLLLAWMGRRAVACNPHIHFSGFSHSKGGFTSPWDVARREASAWRITFRSVALWGCHPTKGGGTGI